MSFKYLPLLSLSLLTFPSEAMMRNRWNVGPLLRGMKDVTVQAAAYTAQAAKWAQEAAMAIYPFMYSAFVTSWDAIKPHLSAERIAVYEPLLKDSSFSMENFNRIQSLLKESLSWGIKLTHGMGEYLSSGHIPSRM